MIKPEVENNMATFMSDNSKVPEIRQTQNLDPNHIPLPICCSRIKCRSTDLNLSLDKTDETGHQHDEEKAADPLIMVIAGEPQDVLRVQLKCSKRSDTLPAASW